MRLSNIITASALGFSCALAQDTSKNAPVVQGNPTGKILTATLPGKAWTQVPGLEGNVKGSVKATSGPGGVGVTYTVEFSNIPKEGGPFTYHLHVAPVPLDGNCTKTLAHLDPFQRGEDPVCDASKPETCQVGDLSGKYGKVTSDPFVAQYHDPYASLVEGVGSYFGNRSFVFHTANKTRISCANFVTFEGNTTTPVYPTGTGSPTGYPTPTSTIPIAAANALDMAKHVAVVPFLALLLLV